MTNFYRFDGECNVPNHYNPARPRMWFCVFAGSAVLWTLLLGVVI